MMVRGVQLYLSARASNTRSGLIVELALPLVLGRCAKPAVRAALPGPSRDPAHLICLSGYLSL